VYFTSNLGTNKLYYKILNLNISKKRYQEQTWSTGVVMVDLNGDGLLIFVMQET
jgi:hypothetical protein